MLPQRGAAQSLPRLVVERFTMSARPVSPTIGHAFALTIVLTVRGNVRRIDNVTLPILSQLELRGDERSIAHAKGESLYRETLTVRANRTGRIELAPATLDAIDARTGQAEQYSSNALTIVVRGGSLQPFATVGSAVGRLVPILERIVLVAGALFAAAALAAFGLLHRRRPRRVEAVVAAPSPVPEPVEEQTRNERLRDAALVLRSEPTRAVARSVRIAVRSLVGATAMETLSDVLSRLHDSERDLMPLLRALERAAFTSDDDLQSAIRTCEAAFSEVLE
uniref:Uncharacterized protein n=1 Tax=mine drainage metagenome TaxID=410659 RepID=E6Q2L2_9ZZZZ